MTGISPANPPPPAAPRRAGGALDRATRRRARAALDLAAQAGDLLLRSGAETARVEATIDILARAYGPLHSTCIVTPTGLFVSVDGASLAAPLTVVRRVHSRSADYARISAVNDLSRRVRAGRVSLEAARTELAAIAVAPDPYSFAVWLYAGAGSAAGSAVLLGGDWLDILAAFGGTVLVLLVATGLARGRIPALFADAAAAGAATAVALALLAAGLPIHANLVIAGGIMKLVPGGALLLAVQDGIAGDLLSSGARGLETLLKGAALASGVGLALSLAVNFGLNVGAGTDVPGGTVWQIPVQVLAAAGAAASYAVSNQVPRFAILTAGLAGGAGWLAYLLIAEATQATLTATFLAALIVGVLSWGLARQQRAPVLLYALPGMLPLLPGLTIFNGMLELAKANSVAGLLVLVHAVSLGGALAAGIALSNTFGPALWRRRRLGAGVLRARRRIW